jgi:hypothetical protein
LLVAQGTAHDHVYLRVSSPCQWCRAQGGKEVRAAVGARNLRLPEATEATRDSEGDEAHAFHNRQPLFLDAASAAKWLNCTADSSGHREDRWLGRWSRTGQRLGDARGVMLAS